MANEINKKYNRNHIEAMVNVIGGGDDDIESVSVYRNGHKTANNYTGTFCYRI